MLDSNAGVERSAAVGRQYSIRICAGQAPAHSYSWRRPPSPGGPMFPQASTLCLSRRGSATIVPGPVLCATHCAGATESETFTDTNGVLVPHNPASGKRGSCQAPHRGQATSRSEARPPLPVPGPIDRLRLDAIEDGRKHEEVAHHQQDDDDGPDPLDAHVSPPEHSRKEAPNHQPGHASHGGLAR